MVRVSRLRQHLLRETIITNFCLKCRSRKQNQFLSRGTKLQLMISRMDLLAQGPAQQGPVAGVRLVSSTWEIHKHSSLLKVVTMFNHHIEKEFNDK